MKSFHIRTAIFASVLAFGAAPGLAAVAQEAPRNQDGSPAFGKDTRDWEKSWKQEAKGKKLRERTLKRLEKYEKRLDKARKELDDAQDDLRDARDDLTKSERMIAEALQERSAIETDYVPVLIKPTVARQ